MNKLLIEKPLYTLTVGEWIELQKSLLKDLTHPKESVDKKELLTIDEASVFLNLSKATLYTMNCHRQIPFTKVSGKIYYRRSALIEWLASGDMKTKAQLRKEVKEGK